MNPRDRQEAKQGGEPPRPLRSFGRTGGRPLSPRRAALVAELLPKLGLPGEGDIILGDLFGAAPRQLWLEIGFGGGEHLAAQAAAHEDVDFIGAEPFVEGVAKLLAEIQSCSLDNVRIHAGDVRDFLSRLPPVSIDRVFILFPDPWPKARHRKRRLVQPDFLDDLARHLRPGARIRFATDIADYAEHALAVFLDDGRFYWNAEMAKDWRAPPDDHFTTRYEQKHLGDCPPVFLDFTFSE